MTRDPATSAHNAHDLGLVEAATVEAWAAAYIRTTALEDKLAPPPPPSVWQTPPVTANRLTAPGRPPELELVTSTPRSVTRGQMQHKERRAQLLHTFLHHELQAAELMCWAILAFPATPRAFRQGLLGICQDEIRHMQLYRRHIESLGHAVAEFPVRDWFWQRVAECETPLQFVALMGMGLEGGNLDHTRRFESWFEDAEDHEGAALQRLVGDEEVAHVRFALHWFAAWSAPDDVTFEHWRAALRPPLTPQMMRGPELDETRRERAGFSPSFLAELRAKGRPRPAS